MELSKEELLHLYMAMQYAIDRQSEVGNTVSDSFVHLQDRIKDEIKL